MPVTSSANATFSQTVLDGSSLKSWKMIPILRRIFGTWRRGSASEVLAVEDDLATGRDLVADEQLDERRLAGAGRADEEHEVALGDDQVHVAQRDLAVGILLGDVVEDQDRPLLRGVIPAASSSRRRSERVGWRAPSTAVAMVTDGSAGTTGGDG